MRATSSRSCSGFQQGTRALAEGRVAEAGSVLEEVARARPQSVAVAVAVAAAKAAGQELPAAEKSLTRAARLHPHDAVLAKLTQSLQRIPARRPAEAPVVRLSSPRSTPSPLRLSPVVGERRRDDATAVGTAGVKPAARPTADRGNEVVAGRIRGRYQFGDLLTERSGVARYRGVDFGAVGSSTPRRSLSCVRPFPRLGIPRRGRALVGNEPCWTASTTRPSPPGWIVLPRAASST